MKHIKNFRIFESNLTKDAGENLDDWDVDMLDPQKFNMEFLKACRGTDNLEDIKDMLDTISDFKMNHRTSTSLHFTSKKPVDPNESTNSQLLNWAAENARKDVISYMVEIGLVSERDIPGVQKWLTHTTRLKGQDKQDMLDFLASL
jgi:hypothetical protein